MLALVQCFELAVGTRMANVTTAQQGGGPAPQLPQLTAYDIR